MTNDELTAIEARADFGPIDGHDVSALIAELRRLQSGLSIIESRWREASQDKCFTSYYRGIIRECAAELQHLLTADDNVEAEIDKAFEAGQL